MRRTISPLDLRDKLGQILEESYYRGDQFIIARRGKPMAALVPISEYQKWLRDKEEFFRIVEKTWEANKGLDHEQLDSDIEQVIREQRQI